MTHIDDQGRVVVDVTRADGTHLDVLLTETWGAFVTALFEFEYCEECGGDAIHHDAWIVCGHWFAHCQYPMTDDGALNPVVAAYRELVA